MAFSPPAVNAVVKVVTEARFPWNTRLQIKPPMRMVHAVDAAPLQLDMTNCLVFSGDFPLQILLNFIRNMMGCHHHYHFPQLQGS